MADGRRAVGSPDAPARHPDQGRGSLMSSPTAATNPSDAPQRRIARHRRAPAARTRHGGVRSHPRRSVPRVLRALKVGVAVVGAAFLLMYVVVAVLRIRSPFELEWIEGGVVDDVRHILAGHQLYVRPSIKFMPYIYTPLYYYVAAGAAKVFGIGFFPLRLVSFVASLGAFGAVDCWWPRRRATAGRGWCRPASSPPASGSAVPGSIWLASTHCSSSCCSPAWPWPGSPAHGRRWPWPASS